MTVGQNVIGLAGALCLWGFGRWREKRQLLGDVPMVPPLYLQIAALALFLALTANLIGLLTGVDWKNGMRP